MDYFTINRWIADPRVPPQKITDLLGIAPDEAKRLWGERQAGERWRQHKDRPFLAQASRFLRWRRKEFGL
jgi:hypothetical protein